jgi:hypothetical protein
VSYGEIRNRLPLLFGQKKNDRGIMDRGMADKGMRTKE